MPQVSVIVPARDVAEYISPLLKDLERQTFADMEVIVVDDGSTDGTLQVIEAALERDRRFRLLNAGGAGVSAARNIGIDAASGEFLAFVDADDRIGADYLQKLHDSITASGSDLVSCNVRRLEGYQTSPSFLHQRGCAVPATATHISRAPHLVWDTTVWNKLWRRTMWDRAGIRYAEGRWLNDFYPCIRGHVASRAVDVIPDVLYYWRIRTDPKTSITDSRLTDPAARLKSFDDRMFAIRSARRMVADELPAPPLLRSLDYRLLRNDLPIYLPYYTESDQRYRDLVMDKIGELLTEFRIRPHRFRLGVQLQSIYEAILARDADQLAELLHPATRVRASQLRRQRTELVLASAGATAANTTASAGRNKTTPHGPVSNRLARLAQKARLRRLDAPPVQANAEIERVELDPSLPTTLVLHGAVRLREGRSTIAGDWTVAASLESTRKVRGTGRLPGRVSRLANRAIQELWGPRARVLGPAVPLEPYPDEILHPLARSGWRPFKAKIDLAETLRHKHDRQWRLAIRLSGGLMEFSCAAKLSAPAAQRLPGGFTVGSDADLVPSVSGGGRLTLRREWVRGRLMGAREVDGGLELQVKFSRADLANGPVTLWLQSRDGAAQGPEIATGGDPPVLPLPEFTGEPAGYDLRCRTANGTGRVRAHRRLNTVRLRRSGSGQELEVVLRPTPQGFALLESRPPQLDLLWLRSEEVPSLLLLGGDTGLPEVGRAGLALVLACTWSGEKLRVPIQAHPDGWQAAVDIAELTKESGGESRVWSLRAVTPSGGEAPLSVPIERRAKLPLSEVVGDHPVRVSLDGRAAPILEVGPEQADARWAKLRKVRRSKATEPAGPVPVRSAELPMDISNVDLSAVVDMLTAPQSARSMTPVEAPSFRAKVDERVRRRRFLLEHTDLTPITQPLINKPKRDRLLAMLGFPVPAKLLEQGDLDEVFRVLRDHDEVVVKPVSGAVGRGVHVLRRAGQGWLNLRTEKEVSENDLRAALEATKVRGRPVPLWQIEQLVVGDTNASGHPMDFKLYLFQGRHGLTHQVRRLPDRAVFKFYDPAWRAADVGRDQEKVDPSLPPPDDAGQLVDLAARVSQALPLPFIRVDVLIGRDGMYVGEVTPMPGRYHQFSDSWDQRLGLLWEAAEVEYGMEFLTAEQFQPALEIIRKLTGTDRLYPA